MSPIYRAKICDNVSLFNTPELIARIFPLLWRFLPVNNYRETTLIPFVISYCRSTNVDSPVEMLLSDSVMSLVFELPYESIMHHIFKAVDFSQQDLDNLNNRMFITRVLQFGLTSTSCDRFIRKRLLEFIECQPSVLRFFTMKSVQLNASLYQELSLKTRVNSAVHLVSFFADHVGDEFTTFPIDKLCELADSLELPISRFIHKMIGQGKLTDILQIIKPLPPDSIKRLLRILKNYKIPESGTFSISVSFGLESLKAFVSDWRTPTFEPA
jgi:hypothetical protein